MNGEPIQVWQIEGHRRVRRWQTGHTTGSDSRHVTVGKLPDGRWYADHTRDGGWAYLTEDEAQKGADALMAVGEWREVPANFGPDAQPTEPGWIRRGGQWFRA